MEGPGNIAIVGGGLSGSLLALGLADAGFRVALIDQQSTETRSDPAFDGRSYALALTSCKLLQSLNIWPDLEVHAQPIFEIKVSDGHAGQGPGPFFMHFDHGEIEEGPMGHMVEDRHLRHALLGAVSASPAIAVYAPMHTTGQTATASGIDLHLEDDQTIHAQLVIGADGRRSLTAERAGINRIEWSYDQIAMVAAIAHEKPHDGVAHQFFMPSGPLAILPLKGNRSSIVWSESAETANAFNALPEAEYLDLLRPRFGDFLGDIQLDGKRYTYPLGLSLAQRMIAPRVALVGDAAHGVHPIAGQGLNAGFRDVGALIDVLSDARARGEDPGALDVLARYESWRRFDNTTLALATDSFNRLFSNDNPLLRAARGLGMAAINGVPSLRRGLIREAAGLAGDLPRLMRPHGL